MNVIDSKLKIYTVGVGHKQGDMMSSFASSYSTFIRYITKESNVTLMYKSFKNVLIASLSPREIVRTALLIIAIQASIVSIQSVSTFISSVRKNFTIKGCEILQVEEAMSSSLSYTEWKKNATDLDGIDDKIAWLRDDNSNFYDKNILRKRIADIKYMMETKDIFNLMFKLRGG